MDNKWFLHFINQYFLHETEKIKCTSKGHILVKFEFDGQVRLEFDGCISAELYQNAKNCLQIVDYTIIYFST